MSTEVNITNDRREFEKTALGYWEKIQENDSRKANDATRKGDRIVAKWAKIGRANDLLIPLLTSESPEVRFTAASHLLLHGFSIDAVPILEELELRPIGFVAPAAQIILKRWRSEKERSQL